VKVYAPELSAVTVAEADPLKVTVAPLPPAAGLIVPEIAYVGGGGGLLEFCPETKPAHPQEKAIALKITNARRAHPACG
jgi:hypothetical protein